ncbi:MAG: SDR family NAD(P)-dependent oxidoreductase, partial [Rubrivivax sp.]|nr:SDR family NAD(P)-dependent oxidoreductase [Rubrivivax sp.]
MLIQGQSAIVTGGGSGLGEAVARELARLGARVALLDVNLQGAQRVAADIGGFAAQADICDTTSLSAALDAAEAAHGPARIVMNIAGIGTAKRVVGKDGSPAPLEDF